MKNRQSFILLLLLILFFSFPQISYPEEPREKKSESKESASIKDEAPEAIFQTKIKDQDVDLYIKGTWDLSITGSIGYDLTSGKFIETPFDEMSPGFVFSQIPDITISLWLMDRFFFEATIKEDSEQNTFLLGYEGKEDEFVQRILLGNTKIDIDDYSFLTISSIPANSLGVSAAFKTRVSYHELLLRYDPAEGLSKEFIGNNEVKRQIFMPTDYYRGRLFILPDTDFENIEVYIEDDNGIYTGSDRRRYKKADNTDYFFSIFDGTIILKKQPESRILVYYTKNGRPIGDVTLGRGALPAVDSNGTPQPGGAPVNFDWTLTGYPLAGQNMTDKQVTINGKISLLVFNRGEYSPFESLSYYQSAYPLPEDISKVRFGISAKSNDPEVIDEKLKFKIEKESGLLYVYENPNGVRDMKNRYPLSNKFSVPVYGPSKNTVPGSYTKELRLEILSPVSSFMLDPDIVPGSVIVTRNGNVETMYDIDYQSGVITFKTYIHPNDRIKVTYKTSYADTDGGDLLFATGNRFFIGDYLMADLAFGIKWNVLQNQYSRFAGQYKGSMLVTGGAEYARDNYKIGVDTGLSITSQDTTGILRLFDMQQSGITMRLGNSYIFPASIPENTTWNSVVPPPSLLPSRNNRGKLIYKDYYSYTLTNASLNNYNWNVPPDQIYSYTTGNPPGPYPANAANDGIQGEILIMDMEEIPVTSWAGSQVPVRKFAEKQDLSDAQSISFKLKCENVAGGKLYIQVGTISEDLDGDTILDKEDSVYSDGFAFNDIANGTVMRVGGVGGTPSRGNGALDSEDNDLNEVLDLEDAKNVVTIDLESLLPPGTTLAAISGSGSWLKINYNFSSDDKKLLAQSSAVRFIYINDSAVPSSGRIFIGELFIESSPFSATVTSAGGSAYAKEVYERYSSSEAPAQKLVDAYPEVKDIFFKNFDITSTQKVLESAWTGTGYTLTGYSLPVPYDTYKKLVGYMRLPQLGNPNPAQFTVSYTDTSGKGVICSFETAAFNDWKKIEIDIEKKKIYLAGEDMGGIVNTSSTDLGLSMLKITCNSDQGKLYVDEIHLTDPKVSVAGAVAATYEHNFPGPVISVKGKEIISNLSIKEYFMYATEDFSVDLTENSDTNNTRTKTTLKTDILRSNLETNVDLSWAGNENYSAIDHTYTSPLFTKFLTFTDSYSESRDLYYLSFSKRDELKAKIGESGGTASASAESILIYDDLSQRWDFKYKSDTRKKVNGGLNLSFIKVSGGYLPEDSWYIENWINSFSLLAADDSDPWPDRTIISENSLSLYRDSFGADFFINAGILSSGEELDRNQKSSGKIELQFPFFNNSFSGWKLTPGYSRSFEYTNRNADGKSFLDDIELWLDDFSQQSYFYTAIPFAEFFLESFEEKFREKSSIISKSRYTPEFFIKFFRGRNPSLIDFIAPSELNIRYSKEFAKDEDSYLNTYRITGEYVIRAINMFGSAGLSPIFSFYKTDEFITRLSITATSVDTHIPQDREFSIGNSLYFAGHKETEFIIDNKFRYVYNHSDDRTYYYDTASASFMWITRPDKRIEVKYFAEKEDPDPYFAHIESVAYSTEPESSISDYNYRSLLLTHESSLVFPEKGNLKLLLSIGIEKHRLYESSNSESSYLLGLQAGLFGKVMF